MEVSRISAGSENPMSEDLFFISRPIDGDAPGQTGTLLELCRELIAKVEEQSKMLEAMGCEISRLVSKVQTLEARANYNQRLGVNPQPIAPNPVDASPFTITYGTTTGEYTATVTSGEALVPPSMARLTLPESARLHGPHLSDPNQASGVADMIIHNQAQERERIANTLRNEEMTRAIQAGTRGAHFRTAMALANEAQLTGVTHHMRLDDGFILTGETA